MAITTTFGAGTGAGLSTVLLDIGSGADAAANTAYTITLTGAIFASSASVSLQSGSSVTLAGPYTLTVPAFAVTGTVFTDLNFTGTITLVNGVFDNFALATNSGGTIVAGLYTGAVLGTPGDAGDIAINSGTITYGGIYAAIQLDSGTIQNGWNGPASALVSGAAGGVLLQNSGLVRNGGTIISSGTTSAAVFLSAGTVDNGQIGNIGARISGGQNGVEIVGAGVVSNDGTITGVASDAVYLGSGTVTNGEIGDLTARISGGPADNGVWIGGIGIVGNFGTITSAGTIGVLLAGGGTLTNGASSDTAALIRGPVDGVVFGNLGSLFNYGTIQANGTGATVIGAFLGNGGTIENLSAASMISGLGWGAVVEGASGSVMNLGTIQASAASGVGVDLVAGGTVVNGLATGSTATIFGGSDGVWISAGAPGAGAVVQNNGTIGGVVGVGFDRSGTTAVAGTLTNNGLIQSTSTSGTSGYAVAFGAGAERLVLQSGGAFIGHVLGNNAPGSSTTLELASGTQGTLSGPSNDGGTVTDSAGSFVFAEFGTIALDAGAAWAVSAPGTLDTLNNAGTLSISGGLVTVTGSVNGTGGLLQIGNGGTIQLDQAVSGQTIKFLTSGGSIGVLDIADFGGFNNTQVIRNFVAGDQIIVGTTAAATFSQSGSLVSVLANGGTLGVLTFDTALNATTAMGALVDQVQVLPCFAAGTRIATERGEVAVEDLRAGDRLRVLLGDELAPVIWIGQRQVNCARHPRPRQVWPVLVSAGAFGPGRPHRDLLLSPDHAVYVNEVLIPVKHLINGSTIAQVPMDIVTYYHVELPQHDVLLAEGLPAESYLDVDDRGNFDNGGAVVRMHPDFASRVWEAEGCAELVVTGPEFDAVRQMLATIAAAERQAAEPALRVAAGNKTLP